MEASLTPDPITIGGKADALTSDDSVEFGQGVEVPIDDRLVEVDPKCLCGLEFGCVGRQVNEADALRHGKAGWAVPAGVVEHEQDDAVPPSAGLAGEQGQDVLEVLFGDAGGQVPEAFPGLGRNEDGDIEPFEAVMSDRDGPLAPRCPDPSQDRLQPEAVLVGGKGLDDRAGMALRLFSNGFGELFLNSACPSGPAALACRGRGRWMVQPIARRASQPRCWATRSSPSSDAITAATFFAVQTPPSSGGVFSRSLNMSRILGVRIVGFAPFPRRRSPNEDGPNWL